MAKSASRPAARGPLSAVIAAATSEPGRAILRCLLGCAMRALSARTPPADRRTTCGDGR